MAEDLEQLVNAITKLGPESKWDTPDGYPQSLALCILDAIWSIGVDYKLHVKPVINRYRAHRASEGSDADRDSAGDLFNAISSVGSESFATDVVDNHQRTSTTSGILKAEACLRAAKLFVDHGVNSCPDFKERQHQVEAGWLAIPGQNSGISWSYLRILTGEQDVKPDRMITRFVCASLNREVSKEECVRLLKAVHAKMGLSADLRTFEHAIWNYQKDLKI